MLLKQLLESPTTSSNLLVYDPFQDVDRAELVKEVIGLANADVDGPRNILFGVNAGAVNGTGIVGIPDSAIGELKRAHRLLSSLIDPVLHLAFVFDRINGKLVGALEIDGCDYGPYFVGQDYAEKLTLGECWVRDGRELRSVERSELMGHAKPAAEAPSAAPVVKPCIAIGFDDDPECELIEMTVPDTSDPPFANQDPEHVKTTKFTRAIKDAVSTVTTQILRLGEGGAAALSGPQPVSGDCDDAGKLYEDAQNHYYYEEKALKLNLCIHNKGKEDIEDLEIELGFPQLEGFDIAHRLHVSPFDKRASSEADRRGYPAVEHRKDAIFVRTTIGLLPATKQEQVFRTALRMAVGPAMQGRKMAIGYKVFGPQKEDFGDGRLKIRFGHTAD